MEKIHRFIENDVVRSLKAFPAVYIAGPRQSGKTTLVQNIAMHQHKAKYITFDDIQFRAAAERDPETFLRSFDSPVVLEEIQMVPELFRPLKIIIDENRQAKNGGRGQFLLTGSASVMALPKLSDALVGRLALHTLLPLSVGEIENHDKRNFIDKAFSKKWKFEQISKQNITPVMMRASFPELLTLKEDSLRYEWCNGYLNTILQRDIRALMEIEKLNVLPGLLQLLATRIGGLLNEASLSSDMSINHITIRKYRVLLENLFLTRTIPAWSKNFGKRLIKSPKIYINDINLMSYLLKINRNRSATLGFFSCNF